MRTVRRLYFCAVALISLEVAVWGVISLARNLFNLLPGSGSIDVLSTGLAMVLAGLPVFLLHWNAAQRDALRDDEERASRVRALFFYAALGGLLVPVAQSALAILDRIFLSALGLDPTIRALVGGSQSTADNLISIVVNLIAAVYIGRILQRDEQANIPGNDLAGVRRLYRYLWMLYGLIVLVSGAWNLMDYFLTVLFNRYGADSYALGNGIALAVVGAPIWVWFWQAIQAGVREDEDNRSMLRLVVLYLLALAGLIITLSAAGELLAQILYRLLGGGTRWILFFRDYSGVMATLVVIGVMWAYFRQQLHLDLESYTGELGRAPLRRLYYYLLSLIGNVTVFFGVQQLISGLVQLALGSSSTLDTLRLHFGGSLAAVIIGLPLWLSSWRHMQVDAARMNDTGDHARRSSLRKGYLYLVLFLSVVGAMVSAGWLLYLIISTLLGQTRANFLRDTLTWFGTLALLTVWLTYHLSVLRADGRLAQRSLGDRHASFPLVVLQAGNEAFTVELVQALQRLVPRLPIAVHRMELGAPGEELLRAGAVVLPAWLAMQPGEALRLWLNEFKGKRILVPRSLDGWIWLGALPRSERDLAQETALAVRQLAEGQEVRASLPANPWAVVGYVLGAIFGLALLIFLVGIVISGLS